MFWMDASVRLTTFDIQHLVTKATQTGGMSVFSYTNRNTFRVTHPTMLQYLPSNMKYLKQYFSLQAGAFILYKTKETVKYLIMWAVLCSLEASCIAPQSEIKADCGAAYQRKNIFSRCHRYDQSMPNILFLNMVNFDAKIFPQQHQLFWSENSEE